ncbi:MAG: helix-turn-helix transcriptional regulator [Flavobacteriaceae bacterium]|nr:helix-turn-helix transcriptional regulator [Flavobacteriaceae bacterium]
MDISERLKILMDYYELTPSGLADQIDVQRSSISHLISGRNKPSLDFVMKILETFPEVDLYWFVNGTGEFPLNEKKISEKSNTQFSTIENLEQQKLEFPLENNLMPPTSQETTPILNFNQEDIDQIVIFYKNGLFKNYNQKK